MARDEIIEMAREADLIDFRDEDNDPHTKQMVEFLQRFATLVAAAEREACARLIQPFAIGEYPPFSGRDDPVDLALCAAAERIRTVSNGLRKALGGI